MNFGGKVQTLYVGWQMNGELKDDSSNLLIKASWASFGISSNHIHLDNQAIFIHCER